MSLLSFVLYDLKALQQLILPCLSFRIDCYQDFCCYRIHSSECSSYDSFGRNFHMPVPCTCLSCILVCIGN
uniref:Uncharacterized protein n=1 Tax=Arundo donax TaxID=35708 RepID=A0A0A9AWC5_ARUDO